MLIGDRADSYGAHGGNMSLEVKAALKDDSENRTLCLSRVYGLGGKDFYTEDAEALLREAIEAAIDEDAGSYGSQDAVINMSDLDPYYPYRYGYGSYYHH